MNRFLKRDDITQLLNKSNEPCVSIFMPTHPTGREQQQDPIRLKNLLNQAEQELKNQDLRTPEVDAFLEPAKQLLSDPDFWQHQNEGLALFLAEGFFRYYHLPIKYDEFVVTDHQFHIKPLLPILNDNGDYYILALSKEGMRLYHATQFVIDEIDLSSIPIAMDKALRFDDPEKHLDFHTSTAPSQGKGVRGDRTVSYHGQGIVNEEKTNILRFFQKFDRELVNLLEEKNIPMVLAGIDYLHDIYHQANTYPRLIETGIYINPDDLSEAQLRHMAWDIVSPLFNAELKKAGNLYRRYAGEENPLASNDPAHVVQAAYFEAVDTLFVPIEGLLWGTFDSQKNTTVIHKKAHKGDIELLNYAAIHTWKNSGSIYSVSPDDVPDDGIVAAIFRYEFLPEENK